MFASFLYTSGWKMLLRLQRAWPEDLPVIKRVSENVDAYNPNAKSIISVDVEAARRRHAFIRPLIPLAPLQAKALCWGKSI